MSAKKTKLRAVIVYLLRNFNNDFLTESKLQRLLYFCDFDYFQITGQHLTGYTYRKSKLGPAIDSLPEILAELADEGVLRAVIGTSTQGTKRTMFVVTNPVDSCAVLSPFEILTIRSVGEKYRELSPTEITTLAHYDFPFAATAKVGDPIQYSLVHYRGDAGDDNAAEDQDELEQFAHSEEFVSAILGTCRSEVRLGAA